MKFLVKCRWADQGCPRQCNRNIIAHHEEECSFRVVQCAACYRGCHWMGSLLRMSAHTAEAMCTRNMWCHWQNDFATARSWIGDYNDQGRPDRSVFNKTTDATWRPVLLVGQEVGPYLIYLTFRRFGTGFWFIIPWSYCCKSMLQQIRIKLELFKMPTQVGWETAIHDNIYTYEGGVVSSQMSESEAMQSGRLLLLHDDQVKLMKKGNAIFEYKVTVSITPQEEPPREESPPPPPPGEEPR